MTHTEALERALQVLEYWDVQGGLHQPTEEAITAIKAALAQQEPDHGDELTIAYMSGVHRGKELAIQPAQEPVAWYVERQHVGFRDHGLKYGPFWKLSEAEELTDSCHILRNLYTTPPAAQPAHMKDEDDDIQVYQRPWVGLTEREVDECYELVMFNPDIEPTRVLVYQAIEAKL
jgi:hypothetical protein